MCVCVCVCVLWGGGVFVLGLKRISYGILIMMVQESFLNVMLQVVGNIL